jgi:hypothetical protein
MHAAGICGQRITLVRSSKTPRLGPEAHRCFCTASPAASSFLYTAPVEVYERRKLHIISQQLLLLLLNDVGRLAIATSFSVRVCCFAEQLK